MLLKLGEQIGLQTCFVSLFDCTCVRTNRSTFSLPSKRRFNFQTLSVYAYVNGRSTCDNNFNNN